MKKLKAILSCTAFILYIILPSSCFYSPLEYFNRSDNADKRAPEIKELNDSETTTLKGSLGTSYDILVMTDIHFGQTHRERHDDDVLDWLDSLGSKPKFCVNMGDTADHGKESEFDDYLQFESQIKTRVSPVYSIIGNHDLRSDGWSFFNDKLYPYTSCYHFETTGMSYYFLDNADGTFGKKQLKNIEDAFKSDSKPKVIFMHCPIYHDKANLASAAALQDTHEADKVLTLFAQNNVRLVMEGHSHAFKCNDFGSFTEFNVPSYVHSRAWGVIHIDESTGSATPELITN
ncbi:MAG: metallophosphoesterase [Treponema sp.]|nr:metallophosphoesterase [Treponema sp.]